MIENADDQARGEHHKPEIEIAENMAQLGVCCEHCGEPATRLTRGRGVVLVLCEPCSREAKVDSRSDALDQEIARQRRVYREQKARR